MSFYSAPLWCHSKEHRVANDIPVAQVFDDDPIEERRRDVAVPNAFGVHDDDRASGADAEAGRFTAFDSMRPEQQAFALEKRGKQAIELLAAPIRRTVSADTHENVPGVWLHQRRKGAGCHKIVYDLWI
jgi:hypothetical protein